MQFRGLKLVDQIIGWPAQGTGYGLRPTPPHSTGDSHLDCRAARTLIVALQRGAPIFAPFMRATAALADEVAWQQVLCRLRSTRWAGRL